MTTTGIPVTIDRPAGPRDGAARPAGSRRVLDLLRALVRGRATDAPWERPSLLGLLGVTALLYLWNLGASGWANAYYSAAVQAGSSSWKAFFFGSFDSSSFITVDKPPVALWVMDLSARLFGLNAWSILVPEALAGVATVALVHAIVRRWFPAPAALIAGAAVALTPVAALMFRFNNPDAVLVLLLTAAAYATVRAVEGGRIAWIALAAALTGTGFLTKMLQAFLVVPALALVYLVAAPTPLRRRILGLGAAAVALVVSSGWWVAVVQLVPASDRPYIGGSQDNSLLSLIFGYNGFGRITGNETGSVGGNAVAGGSMWGPTGWNRMFLPDFGGQIAWLIPAALLLLGFGLWATRRAPRTDRTRAAFLLWGVWLVVTAVVFSYASGIIHPYYTVALAPPVGALVGMGAVVVWERRARLLSRLFLAAVLGATVAWSYVLLDRSAGWQPWLRAAVVVGGAAGALGIVVAGHRRTRVPAAVAGVALLAALAGPGAYTLDTVLTNHDGAIPSAGPAVAGGFGPGGAGGPGGPGGPGGGGGAFAFAGGGGAGRFGPPPGAFGGTFGPPPGAGGGAVPAIGAGGPGGGAAGGGPGGAAGGLLDTSTPSSAVVSTLAADAGSYRWVAATVGANSAAGYQIATGDAVMAIGGFNGTDPTPDLATFEALVAAHEVHWFIAGGGGLGGPGGPGAGSSSQSSAIATWVEAHFTATTVGGIRLYDLSATPSA